MLSRPAAPRSVGLALVVVVLLVGGCALLDDDGASSGPGGTDVVGGIVDTGAWHPGDAADGFGDELELLDQIRVAPRDSGDGYSREQFGERWADVDRNGCDTRNDVLARDLVDVELRRDGCVVQRGTLHDPLTGTVIDFERGPVTSEAVQIDHRVALYDAWRTGARHWGTALRTQFSNDPANLVAVDGPTNQAKGHADAATWLPPNEAYRCEYVGAQVRVKAAYRLWMTPAEHEASRRVLTACD